MKGHNPKSIQIKVSNPKNEEIIERKIPVLFHAQDLNSDDTVLAICIEEPRKRICSRCFFERGCDFSMAGGPERG